MTKDMVMFNLPDGTQVSNDPRFDLDEALEKSLNSRPTTGSVGPTWDEQNAQIIAEKLAALQSGQPGVGENATVDDPTKELHGVLGSPAQQRQVEDLQKAQEAGASPASTSVEDPEPEDSNERVEAVRKTAEEAAEKLRLAADKLGEDGEGNPEEPYSEWTGKQLVYEIRKRNADRTEEEQLELPRKVKDAAALLDEDDARIEAASGNQE